MYALGVFGAFSRELGFAWRACFFLCAKKDGGAFSGKVTHVSVQLRSDV